MQLSKWRECKAKDAEKLLSQWEKVANELFCRASMLELQCTESLFRASKNTNAVFSATKQMKRMQGHGCWKASFSERKLLNAILRVKLKYMKDVSSHEMKCYLQCRRQIFMFRAFLRAKNTNLLELRTLMLCLVQLSKWRECKAKDAEKLLSQWEKVAKCNFKSNAQVHERCFFSWNEMLFAMQKTDFHV